MPRPLKPKKRGKTSGRLKRIAEVPEYRLSMGSSPERIAMLRDELNLLSREARLTKEEQSAIFLGEGPKAAHESAMEKMKKAAQKRKR